MTTEIKQARKREPFIQIPTKVMFNLNLGDKEKMLYAWIWKKSRFIKKDTIEMSNTELKNKFKVNSRTITRAVKNLKDEKVIQVEMSRKNIKGKVNTVRIITIIIEPN